jgi:DNA (cytosine-5)-methyltransferase 1
MRENQLTFLEFFAGGGMARAGLGESWRCLFANDFDAKKVAAYVRNYGETDIRLEDVAKLTLDDLPARPSDLAWASFPCQDLSLAGDYAGLGRNVTRRSRDQGASGHSGSLCADSQRPDVRRASSYLRTCTAA